jgi:SAM-dependent methyltransferase
MSFLNRIAFNLWYYFNPPWDSGISPPELLDFIEKNPATPEQGQASAGHVPRRAIDIGCGTGTNVITLAKAGWKVTGVDFATRGIKIANRKVKKAGIDAELHVRDASDLKGISGPFDLALDMGCFHSMGDKKADYLSELDRILAPGGHWLMYGFFSSGSSGPGLAEADLDLIPASMTLISRRDGFDKRERPSAWFLYQKSK